MTDPVADRWGDAAFTHDLAHVGWMASTAVLLYLNEQATGDPARDWLSGWARRDFAGDDLRVLVLGCGEGWLERAVAQWPFVAHIDAVDVAAAAVQRAREEATRQGLTKINYGVVDLNRDTLRANAYDVIVAHSILHHVENLEHAFAEIRGALKDDGTLIVNEYVGPNRFQYSDRVLSIINDLLQCLPARLRRGAIEQRTYERRERPTVEQMIASDPSEAVRAEELVVFLEREFAVLERRELGGTILQHLLYDIAQNFRFEVPQERAIVEVLCTIEATLIREGALSSDFAIYAARKHGAPPQVLREPLPRPIEANDVDRDPLGFTSRRSHLKRTRIKANAPTLLPDWALRLLRILLVSRNAERANLIEEKALNAAIEQLRYVAARTSPFDWIRARWSSDASTEVDDENGAALAALVDTFESLLSSSRRVRR